MAAKSQQDPKTQYRLCYWDAKNLAASGRGILRKHDRDGPTQWATERDRLLTDIRRMLERVAHVKKLFEPDTYHFGKLSEAETALVAVREKLKRVGTNKPPLRRRRLY